MTVMLNSDLFFEYYPKDDSQKRLDYCSDFVDSLIEKDKQFLLDNKNVILDILRRDNKIDDSDFVSTFIRLRILTSINEDEKISDSLNVLFMIDVEDKFTNYLEDDKVNLIDFIILFCESHSQIALKTIDVLENIDNELSVKTKNSLKKKLFLDEMKNKNI